MTLSASLHTISENVFEWPFLSFWKKQKPRRVSKVSASATHLSPAKQAELEMLCRKLFQKRELITSGRLQLLGLGKVKKRMGGRWPGMQHVIYEICEDTLRKYTGKGDIYIRYSDESYMLLFGAASAEEGEVKTALIAEEIKRRLFDEHGIEDMDVVSQAARIKINKDLPFPDAMNIAFEQSVKVQEKLQIQRNIAEGPKPRIIEVNAWPDTLNKFQSLDLGIRVEEIPFRDVHYVPVWDQCKGRLIAHLCLAKGGAGFGSPVDVHRAYYEGAGSAGKADMDLALLARIIGWMKDNPEKLVNFGIICPVHYESLVSVEGKSRYRALCQKVDDHMKQYLLFMVLDLPPGVPWYSLSQVVSPLKTYGRVLCGQVASSGVVDFETLRLAGFDSVGIILSSLNPDKRVDVSAFVNRAKRYLIHKTFVMGVDDLHMAVEVAAAGVYYMGGQAVHRPLNAPDDALAFAGVFMGQNVAQNQQSHLT